MQLVIMGVSGSGKSTLGERLAKVLGCRFVDGDQLHSPANLAKMKAGIPLEDADRWPWLQRVGVVLAENSNSQRGIIVACSALRRAYRESIRELAPAVEFVFLYGDREILFQRLQARRGHFFDPSLLDSQLATLEPLEPDEPGFAFSIEAPPEKLLQQLLERYG